MLWIVKIRSWNDLLPKPTTVAVMFSMPRGDVKKKLQIVSRNTVELPMVKPPKPEKGVAFASCGEKDRKVERLTRIPCYILHQCGA
jgi:hypothetical protein